MHKFKVTNACSLDFVTANVNCQLESLIFWKYNKNNDSAIIVLNTFKNKAYTNRPMKINHIIHAPCNKLIPFKEIKNLRSYYEQSTDKVIYCEVGTYGMLIFCENWVGGCYH